MFVKITGDKKPPEPGATHDKNVDAKAEFVGSRLLDAEKMHCGRQRLVDVPRRNTAINISGSDALKTLSSVKPINNMIKEIGIK